MLTYDSLADFYNADKRRIVGGEAGYGAHWKLKGWPSTFQVAYVRDTGEVYAYHSALPYTVLMLGVVPADPVADERAEVYYRTLDRLLEGWPEHCGKPNGLSWLIARLAG